VTTSDPLISGVHAVVATVWQPLLDSAFKAPLRDADITQDPFLSLPSPTQYFSACLPACLPAGATAAMYLAAAGYQVDVVERRGHPGQLEVDKRRTYLIGLGEGQQPPSMCDVIRAAP